MAEGEPQNTQREPGLSDKLMLAYLDTLTPEQRLRLWQRRPDVRQELEALTSLPLAQREIDKYKPYSRALETAIEIGVTPYLYAKSAIRGSIDSTRRMYRNLVL